MSSTDISVIICTYNRASFLSDVLRSLEMSEIPKKTRIDLVIVDNASSDNTFLVIEDFAKHSKFNVMALKEPKQGKTFALNTAISNSQSDFLVFIDDDHIVSKDFIKAIYAGIEKYSDYNLFCGRVVPNWDGSEPSWIHDDNKYPIRPFPIPNFNLGDKVLKIRPDKGMFIPGAGNLVIRRSVFKDIGLFNEEFGPRGHSLQGGEDIEFVRRALKQGERLIYIPEILQYHQVEKEKFALHYLIRKAYYRSKVAYQLNEEISFGSIPLYMYRMAASHLVKSIFSLRQAARRYYLVKLAAVIGEMRGHRKGHLHE